MSVAKRKVKKKRTYHLTFKGRAGRRNSYNRVCNDCGRNFEEYKWNANPECPDCGSTDTSIDEED